MNSTMYNAKMKRAHVRANYVSKEKYKRVKVKPRRYLRREVGYCFEALFLLKAFAHP